MVLSWLHLKYLCQNHTALSGPAIYNVEVGLFVDQYERQ